jgi:cytochrome c
MRLVFYSLLALPLLTFAAHAQDLDSGKKVFTQCRVCHQIGPKAKSTATGPSLNNLIGRKSGTLPNFSYSSANKNSGITWTEDEFLDYIKDPAKKIPKTKMIFVGVKDEQKAKDLLAYIRQFDEEGNIK